MQFTLEQVLSFAGTLGAIGISCWRLVVHVETKIEAERKEREAATEVLRARIHKLGGDTMGMFKDYATKERVDQLERVILAARGPLHGDE